MNRWFIILLATLLGAVLLALSVPRLRSDFVYLRVDNALRNHWVSRPIPRDRYPELLQAAQTSIAVLDDGRYRDSLAWLQYLYAQSLGLDSPQRQDELRLAKPAFEAALSSTPASPRNWLQLGWINATIGDPKSGISSVIEAWRMSVLTGRAERHLLVSRLELGLRYAEFLTEDDLDLLRDQLLLAWRYRRGQVKTSILSSGSDLKTIRGLLYLQAPDVLDEMEQAHDKHR